jgi:hypothetical protein
MDIIYSHPPKYCKHIYRSAQTGTDYLGKAVRLPLYFRLLLTLDHDPSKILSTRITQEKPALACKLTFDLPARRGYRRDIVEWAFLPHSDVNERLRVTNEALGRPGQG